MSDSKPIKTSGEDDVVTINIQPFVTPISILLSAVIVASSLLIGLNNLGTALKGSVAGATTTTGTTTTGTTATGTTGTATQDQIQALFDDSGNMSFGDSGSKVLFVEFSDPSCPYCHIASGKNPELNRSAGSSFQLNTDGGTYVAPVVEFKKLVDEGKAAYAWFYTNGHGNGEMGAKALYCADEQGKFWETHDLLYSNAGYNLLNDTVMNDKSKSGDLSNFLAGVLDANTLKSCLDSGKYDSKISTDQSTGMALGVSGTPGFFVNNTNYAGAYSYTDMQATVEAALAN